MVGFVVRLSSFLRWLLGGTSIPGGIPEVLVLHGHVLLRLWITEPGIDLQFFSEILLELLGNFEMILCSFSGGGDVREREAVLAGQLLEILGGIDLLVPHQLVWVDPVITVLFLQIIFSTFVGSLVLLIFSIGIGQLVRMGCLAHLILSIENICSVLFL